jgi:hypothetical protein
LDQRTCQEDRKAQPRLAIAHESLDNNELDEAQLGEELAGVIYNQMQKESQPERLLCEQGEFLKIRVN